MKREKRRFTIPFEFDWEYGISIKDIKKDLEALEKLGATHIDIEADISYDCAYMSIDASCLRMETKEEFTQRKNRQEARILELRKRELEKLEELKLKYEPKE